MNTMEETFLGDTVRERESIDLRKQTLSVFFVLLGIKPRALDSYIRTMSIRQIPTQLNHLDYV